MDNFLNTKIFRSKSLEKISIDPLDIPSIDFDNAILYEYHDDDYSKLFSLVPIKSGLIKHNDRYYLFYHDIINTPKTYKGQTCHSFNIYPIKNDFAQEIIKNKSFHYWMVIFHSFYYYGEYYLSIRNGNYIKWHKYTSDKNDIGMTISYNISPILTEGVTIGKFIEDHRKRYPKSDEMNLNKSVIREQQIFDIFK